MSPEARAPGRIGGGPPAQSPHDRYVVLEYLAEGGMGAIYRGKKLGAGGFEKEVVLKQLLPEFTQQPEFIDLFLREAKLSATLDHANIVRTIDLVAADEAFFIVMEFVRGGDLRTLSKRAKRRRRWISPAAALFVAREISSALSYAHAKIGPDGKPLGLIHRDVSPSNILISGAGEVKLTDFGIAKASTHRSVFYKVRGKVGYMSPEQARGDPLDSRADLYSLAICLYELLTGERLFVAATLTTSPEELYGQPIPRVSRKRPGLPEDLDSLMWRALDMDPNGRFQTAAELQDALLRVAHKHKMLISPPELASHLREVCGNNIDDWRSIEIRPEERVKVESTQGFKVEDSSYDGHASKRPGTAVIGPDELDEDDEEAEEAEEAAAIARRALARTEGKSSYIELDENDEWADEMDVARKEEAKKAAVEALSRLSKVELESFIDAPSLPKRPPTGSMEALKEKSGEVVAPQLMAAARAPVKAAAKPAPAPAAKPAKVVPPLVAPKGPVRHPTTPGPQAGIETEQVDRVDLLLADTERQAQSEWPPDLSEGRAAEVEPEVDDDTHLRPWVVALAALVIGGIIATVVALTGPKVPEPASVHSGAPQPPLPLPAALASPDASLAVVTPLMVPDAGAAKVPAPTPAPAGSATDEPAPQSPGVAVESVPPGATAKLGEATCKTPCTLTAPPGLHTIRVEAAGKEPWAGLAEVRKDLPAQMLALLKPAIPKRALKKRGVLVVHANAPAEIYLDGKETGKVAGDAISLPPGSYQVMLVNPQKRARPEANVMVHAGKTTQTPALRFR